MSVTVIMYIEKSRLGCRFQRHRPLHIVIVGSNGSYLVKRQHWDLLQVQSFRLDPEGMSRVHPGEPGWVAPGLQAGVGARCSNSHGTSDKPANTQRKEVKVVNVVDLLIFSDSITPNQGLLNS